MMKIASFASFPTTGYMWFLRGLRSRIQNELRDSHLLHERIPDLLNCSLSFFMGTDLGVYPSVKNLATDSTLWPNDRVPVDPRPLLLTGSSLTRRCPQCDVSSQQRTYHNLCCTWHASYVPAWHFTDGDVALLTEQARGGVRQVCDPCLHEDPGQQD